MGRWLMTFLIASALLGAALLALGPALAIAGSWSGQ
jgi:hypothetical protein